VFAPQRKACARLDGLYGQGWNAETVQLVIKRQLGDRIRSRSKSESVAESAACR